MKKLLALLLLISCVLPAFGMDQEFKKKSPHSKTKHKHKKSPQSNSSSPSSISIDKKNTPKNKKAGTTLSPHEAQAKMFKVDNNDLQKRLKDSNNRLSQANGQINSLKVQLAALSAPAEQIATLTNHSTDLNRRFDAVEKERDNLLEQLQMKDQEIQTRTQELSAFAAQIQALIGEKETLAEQLQQKQRNEISTESGAQAVFERMQFIEHEKNKLADELQIALKEKIELAERVTELLQLKENLIEERTTLERNLALSSPKQMVGSWQYGTCGSDKDEADGEGDDTVICDADNESNGSGDDSAKKIMLDWSATSEELAKCKTTLSGYETHFTELNILKEAQADQITALTEQINQLNQQQNYIPTTISSSSFSSLTSSSVSSLSSTGTPRPMLPSSSSTPKKKKSSAPKTIFQKAINFINEPFADSDNEDEEDFLDKNDPLNNDDLPYNPL